MVGPALMSISAVPSLITLTNKCYFLSKKKKKKKEWALEREHMYTVCGNVNWWLLWKTVWYILKKLKIQLPCDPAISVLGIYEKNTNSKRYTYPNVHSSMCVCSVAWSCPTLWSNGLYSARLLSSWDSPGKNTGVGSHSLLQGIFLTHWWNPGLLHCRQILYCLSHQGSPRGSVLFTVANRSNLSVQQQMNG